MASIRERHHETTGTTTWAVLYRRGGRQTSTTFESEDAAENFRQLIDMLGADKALATVEAQATGGLMVDELFEEWIAWRAAGGGRQKVTARTLKDYRRDYENWIQPHLGHRHADTLDERDVQKWVDNIGRSLDPKSVADKHMILGSLFKYGSAKTRQIVEHNPCQETQLPARKKKAPKGFSPAQWQAMHAWGREHELDADDLLLFIASTGWRFSEATPVIPAAVEDYGDLDFNGRSVPMVFVSVLGVHRRDENDRTVYVDREGKSHAAIRRVNLPPEAARMVRRRLVGLGPEDLLFTNKRGRQWRSSNFLEREFSRILDGAGIAKTKGMGAHFLRHSHVGDLDRAGVSIAKTQRRIGHENITTTLGVYGGTIDNALTPEELLRLDDQHSPTPVKGEVVQGETVQALPG